MSQLGATTSNTGAGLELFVVTAIILGGASLTGGRGTIVGTVLGLLILGVIGNGLVLLNVVAVLAERRSRSAPDRCGRPRPGSPQPGAWMMSTEADDTLTSGVHLHGIEMRFNAVRALKGSTSSCDQARSSVSSATTEQESQRFAIFMAGALSPDKGRIVVDGTARSFSSVRDAHVQGITMLFQDLALCDDLNVADNFFVGREPTRFGIVRHRWMHAQTRRNLETLDIRLPSTKVPVSALSGGQRQSLAIARAVSFSPRVLILDEPTAALGVRQAKATLDTIRRLRANRIGIVLISHRMSDVLSICDRVTVLYEGRVAADVSTEDLTVEEIVRYIVTDPDADRPVADHDRADTRSTAER